MSKQFRVEISMKNGESLQWQLSEDDLNKVTEKMGKGEGRATFGDGDLRYFVAADSISHITAFGK